MFEDDEDGNEIDTSGIAAMGSVPLPLDVGEATVIGTRFQPLERSVLELSHLDQSLPEVLPRVSVKAPDAGSVS